MHIRDLKLSNFKRFENAQIDLSSKITVLVGPNSSGKSSILKALLALKQTASPTNENEALATQGDYVDLGVYRDYIYNHEVSRKVTFCLTVKSRDLHLGAFGGGDIVVFQLTLGHDHITEQARLLEVQIGDPSDKDPRITITKKQTRDSFLLRLSPEAAVTLDKSLRRGDAANAAITASWEKGISLRIDDRYQMSIEKKTAVASQEFSLSTYPVAIIRRILDGLLRSIDRDIFYIGPLRRSPSRSYARTGHLLSVGAAGEYTPSVLANLKSRAAKERSANPIQRGRLAQLQEWVERLFPGRTVEAKSFDELVKLVIGRESNQGEAISDVGFGISQILPILVQIAVMPDDSTLLIEQPELHLHPSVQTALAEIIATASNSGRRFVVETHSEHFVRGLQLAISNSRAHKRQGVRVQAKDVNFLYVPSTPKRPESMAVNEWGEFVKEWPKGFFDEAYRLAMLLLENKMKTQATEAERVGSRGDNS